MARPAGKGAQRETSIAAGALMARVREAADADAAAAQAAGIAVAPVGTPENPSHRLFTIANVITLIRFALTIVFLILFVSGGRRYLAVACYAIAATTDFLDGQIARRTQTVSWFGKIVDPVMDRILLFTGVTGLVITGELPLWVAIYIVVRDSYLAVGAAILQHYRRRPVDVTLVGKAATALLMFGFSDLLLGLPIIAGPSLVAVSWLPGLNGSAAPLGIFFVYAGVVASLAAAITYTHEGLKIRSSARANISHGMPHGEEGNR